MAASEVTHRVAPVRLIERGNAGQQALLDIALPVGLPLVSCLMVTGNRPTRAMLAIECFVRQTYPRRELVIIDDGLNDTLSRHVAELANPQVRLIRLPPTDQTLGELRNVAVASAAGELVCQWDDDDLYDPHRLHWQIAALTTTSAAACFLERWTIVWTDGPRIGLSTRRIWEGSMIATRASLTPYPALRRGEDSVVTDHLVQERRVALLDLPDLYTYLVHGANTFPMSHFDAHWQAATLRFEDPATTLDSLNNRVPIHAALTLPE